MKKIFLSIVVLLLFLISPFVQSDTSDESQPELFYYIPPIISQIAFYLRWVLMLVLLVNTLINAKIFRNNFSYVNKYFLIFYSIPLLYALVTFTDVYRYIFIFIFLLLVPISITSTLQKNFNFLYKYFIFIITFLLLISYFVSFNSITSQIRFQGIFSNSNSYSISACFWLSILLIKKGSRKSEVFKRFLILFLFISIFLSGSRIALLFSVFLLLYNYISNVFTIIKISIISIILFFLALNYLNLDFVLDRFTNVANSAEESGRKEVWDVAFSFIRYNYLGYGMNAPDELLKTGNVHNCYIRFLLTIGLPFTFAMLFIYLILLLKMVINKNKLLPNAIIGFFIAYSFANYGEDYFAGLGSSMFVYINILIGFSSYYLTQNCKQINLITQNK